MLSVSTSRHASKYVHRQLVRYEAYKNIQSNISQYSTTATATVQRSSIITSSIEENKDNSTDPSYQYQYRNFNTNRILHERGRKRRQPISKLYNDNIKEDNNNNDSVSKILLNIDFNDITSISKAIHNLSTIKSEESGEEALKILEIMRKNPERVQPDVM